MLFFYGMAQLAATMKEAAGEHLKGLLARMTSNAITGLPSGCMVTIILDSSSVTIILVIGLVHAGALTFDQSLAVIFGSNIGTTVSSQVYAVEVDRFSPVLLAAGLLAVLLYRNKPAGKYGYGVFFLGLFCSVYREWERL
jgi:phosphate:Na+ symporter